MNGTVPLTLQEVSLLPRDEEKGFYDDGMAYHRTCFLFLLFMIRYGIRH